MPDATEHHIRLFLRDQFVLDPGYQVLLDLVLRAGELDHGVASVNGAFFMASCCSGVMDEHPHRSLSPFYEVMLPF